MSDCTFGRKKAASSNFSNPSLVSPTTPTLANPVRGFGLPTNNVIQTATEVSTELQEVQSADERSLEEQAIKEKPITHHISRISLRRPQAKLTVGEPGDKYEQEADMMAKRVMSMPATTVQRQIAPEELQTKPLLVQREAMSEEEEEIQTKSLNTSIQREICQEEEELQTKPSLQRASNGSLEAGDSIESRLNSSKGGGSSLADEVRNFMEPRFGADFSQVRVHSDREAVQMNRELGAQAFTHQSDVYYGEGKAPGNNELTAHELTHVVQQTGSLKTQYESDELESTEKSAIATTEPAIQKTSSSPLQLLTIEEIPTMLQLRRTRDAGVLDNGVLTQDIDVVLGNLSGRLPRGTYVEIVARLGDNYRVRVWSGYGGQETTIPVTAFVHEDQRHDSAMDQVDLGAYASIPVDLRLPFMPSARFSQRAEVHEGVLDNGRLTQAVRNVSLGGAVGTLPAGTYIEVIRINPDGGRVVRVWSGYGGQETTLPANVFTTYFTREQRSDQQIDIPDLQAYYDFQLDERLPLMTSVRLQVIDNGVITRDIDTLNASLPIVVAGTYVEVLEYRGHVVVFLPHSGSRPGSVDQNRFITAESSIFRSAFQHQPQITDEYDDASDSSLLGRVDQRVQYVQRNEPLWGSSGPQLEDIRQGTLGSCGVLAAAGALLHEQPRIITDQIFQGNSPTAATFQIYLYPQAASGISHLRIVTVDRYFPADSTVTQGDSSFYASTRRALWPAVLEKAFAEVFNGYDNLTEGSNSLNVMRVLTGNVPQTPGILNPSSLDEASLLQRLQNLETARSAVTMESQSSSQYYLNQRLRIIADHAYTFTHLDGNQVQLFNPHGTDQPLPLTMAQVRQYFASIVFR